LHELLKVRVPKECFKGKRKPKLLMCDLDETIWERFPEDVCHRVAAEVVRTVGRAARMPLPIWSARVPAIPDDMTLADMELEIRTVNCLVSAGIHERPQDLHAMTLEHLLGLRGFWVKSLVDLLTSLEYVIDHPETRKKPQTNATVTIKHLRALHRYPRPGHRLAPQTLKESLLDRLPSRLVRGTKFRKLRLCDLDETAWEHLSPAVIGQLASMIILRAGATAHSRTILRRPLPKPPRGMRLEDLQLENRTHNCLQREGFGRAPEKLGRLTIAELLSVRAFGSKCLVDLLTSLETLVAREGKLDKKLTAKAEALSKLPEASRIQFTDPRLGSLLRAMDTESNSIKEMMDRIVHRRLDPPDPLRLHEQLRELGDKIRQLRELPLEKELIQIFAPGSGERDQQIVAEYYGWDGHAGRTLEELGRRYGLSRERIRQICVRAIKRNRDTRVFAPVLDRALEFLAKRFPKGLDRLQAEFDKAGFANCRLPVESVRQAGGFLERRPQFVIVDIGRNRLAVHPKHVKLPRRIVHAAKQVVINYGAARISEVSAELAAGHARRIHSILIRETLQARPDFRWLDQKRSWFRLDLLPQYGLPNMIEKILSVTGQVQVSTLRTAMARYRRSGRKLPPTRILLEFSRQMPGVHVEGKTIISEPPRDWRKTLTGVEKIIVGVLTEHGPVMERTGLEELCLKRGMNRFSFNALLMSSPVVAQYGRSVYGLVGLRVHKKTVDKLLASKPATVPSRVLRAYGQTADGRVSLAYRLSKAAISGGVITVPAAVKRQLYGRFALRDSGGHRAGTLVAKKGCGWGLGPALRRQKAKAGEHLLLLFDLDQREAGLQIGDKSIFKGTVDL